MKDLPPIWGKNPSKPCKKKERTDEEKAEYPQLNHYWKKKSIFFELEYWKHLLLWHNLDVMHTEKNVIESILNTLLSVKDRSKDDLTAHQDLQHMKIRKELHPTENDSGKAKLPRPCFGLSREEKKRLC